jgi:hypothetical protein
MNEKERLERINTDMKHINEIDWQSLSIEQNQAYFNIRQALSQTSFDLSMRGLLKWSFLAYAIGAAAVLCFGVKMGAEVIYLAFFNLLMAAAFGLFFQIGEMRYRSRLERFLNKHSALLVELAKECILHSDGEHENDDVRKAPAGDLDSV